MTMTPRTLVWAAGLLTAAPLWAQVGPQGSSVVEVGLALRQVDGVKRVLTAAALTYVAAAVTSILMLLYYISLARR